MSQRMESDAGEVHPHLREFTAEDRQEALEAILEEGGGLQRARSVLGIKAAKSQHDDRPRSAELREWLGFDTWDEWKAFVQKGSYNRRKDARRARSDVLERDGRQCVVCGREEDLEVHHVNFQSDDGRKVNLLTLCADHHRAVTGSVHHPNKSKRYAREYLLAIEVCRWVNTMSHHTYELDWCSSCRKFHIRQDAPSPPHPTIINNSLEGVWPSVRTFLLSEHGWTWDKSKSAVHES